MSSNVQISEREREILRLVAKGATNQQIANQLNISVNTVKVHLRNIFGKIGVVSRTEATLYAIRNGIITLDDSPQVGVSDIEADIAVGKVSPPAPARVEAAPPQVEAEPVAPVAVTSVSLPSGEGEAVLSHGDEAEAASPLPAATEPAPPVGDQAVSERPGWRRMGMWLAIAGALVIGIVGWLIWSNLRPIPVTPPSPTAAGAGSASDERWIVHAPVPRPRQGFALLASPSEGRLYVVGGSDEQGALPLLDRYDPKMKLWVSLADKPTPVSAIRAAELRGKIYVPGGELADGTVTDRFEVYDPRDQRWYSLASLPAPRSRYGLAVWEGKLYVLGGWDGQQERAEVFIYDPERNGWQSGLSLPEARQYASAAVVSDRLYVVGGERKGEALRDCLRLEAEGNAARWQYLPPLPEPIGRPQTVALLNTLLALDGQGREVWQYDGGADAWMPYPLSNTLNGDTAIALLNTGLFFVAGAQAAEPGAVREYQVLYTIFVPGPNGGLP